MGVHDDAVLAWARDWLVENHIQDYLDRTGNDAAPVSVTFEGWIGCYSSWTCDYGVHATIVMSDGFEHQTGSTFNDLLTDLTDYVEAERAMLNDHDRYHGWDDNDSRP